MKRFLQALILAPALALVAGIVPAAAQALFLPPTTADESIAAAHQLAKTPLEIRTRVAHIDSNALTRHLAPTGADQAADRASRASQLDGVITLNLFPDVTATFRRTDVSKQDDGGYIWEGEVSGQPFHEALLLVRDGEVFGRVQLFNRVFRLDRLGKGVIRITELDQTKFPAPSDPLVPPNAAAPAPGTPDLAQPTATKTKTTIRVMVVYTQKTKSEAGGTTQMTDEIKTAVASANQAYTHGNIPILLQLAGTMQVNYVEGNDVNYSANLQAITNGTGGFSGVAAKRATLKADLVSLFRAGPDLTHCPCQTGLAWLPGAGIMPAPSAGTKQYGYSVIGHKGIFDFVFQHELGHNFGLNHDRPQYIRDGHSNPPNADYNFGYTNLNAKIYTIMAYYVTCENAHPGQCAHVNYFSSPTIRSGGSIIGVAKGHTGAADNTSRMIQNYKGIAAYE